MFSRLGKLVQLKTLLEKEEMLVTPTFSLSNNVFDPSFIDFVGKGKIKFILLSANVFSVE